MRRGRPPGRDRRRRRATRTPTIARLRPPAAFDQQVFDRFLPQRQVRLLFDEPLDFLLIGLLVGLGPGAVHGRALAAVEHAELDAGGVDRPAHGAAQGVDLADDLPLGHAADGRIAAHLADRVEVGRQQRGGRAHPRRRHRRLAPGMSAADDDDVEVVCRSHTLMIEWRGTAG